MATTPKRNIGIEKAYFNETTSIIDIVIATDRETCFTNSVDGLLFIIERQTKNNASMSIER